MALHVKRGDTVQIMAGDHKGATGRVLHVNLEKKTVVVQGQNIAKRHVRPSRRNPQGGRVSVEQPIHISNVLPVNPKSGKATRVRFELGKKGEKKRVALDGTDIGAVSRAK
jgi:large subunit ribosomal protein L24